MSTPTIVYPSLAFLNSLYNSLCSTLYSMNDTDHASIQSFTIYYLNNLSNTTYENMAAAIYFWLNSTTIPHIAVGIPTGIPAKIAIPGLRILVLNADGSTAFDSYSQYNSFANIGIPKADFMTSGKYLINENHGTRTYFQGAMLSQTGNFSLKKWSNSTGTTQIYLAVRQGLSANEPFGAIVLTINGRLD